jgi:hypothetical protein
VVEQRLVFYRFRAAEGRGRADSQAGYTVDMAIIEEVKGMMGAASERSSWAGLRARKAWYP